MNNEHILQLHPILRAQGVEIYWNDHIGKINTHGDVQPRYLVITSIGIFLLVKRTFPSGFKISRIIPISRLKSITLTTDYLALDSEDESMVLEHKEINKISALLISIQTNIMGYANFKASTQLKLVVSDIVVSINTEHPIINKFLSECLALNVPLQLDQVNSVCKTFEENPKTFSFTPSIAASSLMPAIVNTLKGNTTFNKITLKDLSFMSFSEHFGKILKESTSIQSILFQRMSFLEKNLAVPTGFFEKTTSPIKEVEFLKCDLTNPKFKEIFYEFAKIKTNIEVFSIDTCDLAQSSIEAIFYSIFDAPCFRSLKKLSINEAKNPDNIQVFVVQLMNCDWILKNKSLKELVLNNTPLKLEFLLSALMMFETGLTELSLSGCSFMKPIPANSIETFQDVTTIDLSGISTTSSALLSLFKQMSTAKSQLISLDFTSMKMSEAEKLKLYSEMPNYKLGNIQTLVWDGNVIPNEKVKDFADFLSLQTSVIDLSISNCIQGASGNAAFLEKPISALNLERFVMVGSDKCSFGTELNPIIKELTSKSSLTSLDITGHGIGDEGIRYITQYVQSHCKCIAFGKTSANSIELLLNCINEIVNSKTEFAVWPANDVKRVITKVSLGQRDKMIKEFGNLKKKFCDKFGIQPEPEIEAGSEGAPMALRRMTSIPLLIRASSESLLPRIDKVRYDTISFKEEKIKGLLTECLGPNSQQPTNDPLVVFFNEFTLETSIDRFVLQSK